MDYDASIMDEFLSNAREHLETMERDFLSLEAVGESDPELVARVFRAVHSIKGGAGFMGYRQIERLSHRMESLLAAVREGEVAVRKPHVDALLAGTDLLRAMIEDVNASDAKNISNEAARLEKLLTEGRGGLSAESSAPAPGPATPARDSGPVVSDPPTMPSTGFPLDRAELQALFEDHDEVYVLEYDLGVMAAAAGRTPLDIIMGLGGLGRVVDTVMTRSQTGTPVLKVLFGSILEPEYMSEAAGLQDSAIIRLPRPVESRPTPPPKPVQTVDAQFESQPAPQSRPDAKPATRTAQPESAADSSRMKDSSASIRINLSILDRLMSLAGELVLVRNQQLQLMERMGPGAQRTVQRLDVVTTAMQEMVMRTRMQPIGNIFGKIPRIVRDLCHKLRKHIEVHIAGGEVELDKTILESLADPLTHIIRNCCDHGIELPEERERGGKTDVGAIHVSAAHESGQIVIEIRDDGRGIDPDRIRAKVLERKLISENELSRLSEREIVSLIMLSGFSTATEVSDISGRGVGMDVVKKSIDSLGGTIELESFLGEGTTIRLRLPLTLAIIPSLIVRSGDYRYAVPQVAIQELVCLYDDDVRTKIEIAGEQEVYRLRERLLPLVRLSEVLKHRQPMRREVRAAISERFRTEQTEFLARHHEALESGETDEEFPAQSLIFAVMRTSGGLFGLIVDKVVGTEEIVVKPTHPALKSLRIYSGATVLGDGQVALILDMEGIAAHARVHRKLEREQTLSVREVKNSAEAIQSVLIFKVGEAERFAVGLPLIKRVEQFTADQVQRVGGEEYLTVDGVSTMLLRLDRLMRVSPLAESEQLFLLIPKFIDRPFGILMSSIEGIVEVPLRINDSSHMQDGLIGTDIVDGAMTLFLDIYRIVEMVDPAWFDNRRKMLPPRSRKRIMLIEDTPYFRQLVKKYLEADEYEVLASENGREALSRLETEKVDLVVSDIDMPVMNGWDFIRAMRKSDRLHNLPAMALTALNSDQDRERALKSGFNHYEIKIDRERFLSSVARLLGGK